MNKLIIGCHDFTDESGFQYCSHFSNEILDTSQLDSFSQTKVNDFLESSCDFLLKPCHDFNKIVNIINYLYKKYSVIEEDKLIKIQKLFQMYKGFGLYMILIPYDTIDKE